jgi:hypothetical protein
MHVFNQNPFISSYLKQVPSYQQKWYLKDNLELSIHFDCNSAVAYANNVYRTHTSSKQYTNTIYCQFFPTEWLSASPAFPLLLIVYAMLYVHELCQRPHASILIIYQTQWDYTVLNTIRYYSS